MVSTLPEADKRAVIGDLAQLYEREPPGWHHSRQVMPAIAPHLTPDEARRFTRAVATRRGSSCVRTIVLAHLADAGRASPSEALAAMRENHDVPCLEPDELNVLRFADPPTLRALYPREMALLDQPPTTFTLEHVRILEVLAPYLEPKRRQDLLGAAFRVMPKLYGPAPDGHQHWGDLPPEFHFHMAMRRFVPLMDAALTDAALRAIPPTWPPESRWYAAVFIVAALPAHVQKAKARDLLAALPGPKGNKAAATARLELAAHLRPDEVRAALDVVVEAESLPSRRAQVIAGALPALPPPAQPAYAARVRAEVAGIGYADGRLAAAARVLDALEGIPQD